MNVSTHKLYFYFSVFFLIPVFSLAQSIQVEKKDAQELIENILINNDCITNINVTNHVSGNFGDGDKSYGYFNGSGTDFPFKEGIVLTTGKLNHTPGPNNGLSDDNAPNWIGDDDLENYLDLNHTVNATILEFDFTPNVNNIRFRYIFASEEYRENQATTCQYSDAFAFLIRPVGETQYKNIALVPGTDIPVKVTTVHSGIPGSCPPQNEEYFAGYNGFDSPIIFNGQTEVLTAEAEVIGGQAYHIKLVIADDINYRYDSAVFLEANSFRPTLNLIKEEEYLCPDDDSSVRLQVENPIDGSTYTWFHNGTEIPNAHEDYYDATQPGRYKVEVDFESGCLVEAEIDVEEINFNGVNDLTLSSCEVDDDLNYVYDIQNGINRIINMGTTYQLNGVFHTRTGAETGNPNDEIRDYTNYHSSEKDEKVYARIRAENCYKVIEITLTYPEEDALNQVRHLYACPDENGVYTFSLTDLDNYDTRYFTNRKAAEAGLSEEEINGSTYQPPLSEGSTESIFAQVYNTEGCQGIYEVFLHGLPQAQLNEDFTAPILCIGENSSISIDARNLVKLGEGENFEDNYQFQWEGQPTGPFLEDITESGSYRITIWRITENIETGAEERCPLQVDVMVGESQAPQNVSHQLHGDPDQYKVEIFAEGAGDYQYSVDNSPWQQDNIFTLVKSGLHEYTVEDVNGCGSVTGHFYTIHYMKFFTPNNDGINDEWKVEDYPGGDLSIQSVYIFDRYGKLLVTLRPGQSWDGTYNGRPMPSNDYWFSIHFKDGSSFKRNFSLIRK